MRYYYACFWLISLLFATELNAQCTGGSNEGNLTPMPSTTVNTISIKGGRYYTFAANAGEIFLFSTHPNDGGLTAFDTKITILDNSGTALAFDDDFCDRSSRLVWTAPSTATYRVLMMRFNCVGTGTPSTMAYQILNSYTPEDYSCSAAPCTNDEYNLLVNMPSDFFDYVSSGGEPDANGMIGSNQSSWQGAEFQRGGVRRMLSGIIYNDVAMMDDAWLTIEATFKQQEADGGFDDNSSDAAFWLHECSHSLLVLKESPLYTTYLDSVNKYLPFIQDALEYITSPVELDLLFNTYDKQAANRLFIDANAIALTGLLINDTATYLPISRTFIAQGLELLTDSVYCEKGGHDTSYQGTSLFELNYYMMRFPYAGLDCKIRAATIWEANRVDVNGFVDTVGNTRTGNCQEIYNGVCKEINFREVARSLYYYGYRFCDATNGINPAIRVYRYDQNDASYNPTVNCANGCSPLPVELAEFKAICENGQTVLKWKTASEKNNSHFVVELNRHGFEEIGRVNGNGTTSNISNYTFTHRNEDSKTVYYRLKQVDFDGNFEYSNTIAVDCFSKNNNFRLFPNPTNGEITLQFDKAISNEILIFDILGRLVFNDFIKNKAEVQLDLKLTAGVYFLQMEGDSNYQKTIKVIKKSN